MELLSLVLTLKPLQAASPEKPLPIWWGRAAHALLLAVARQGDPQLAASLHPHSIGRMAEVADVDETPAADQIDQMQMRPFTVSNLIGTFLNGGFKPQATYTLRFTAFHQDLAQILSDAAQHGPLAPGRKVELDFHPFEVVAACQTPDDASCEDSPTDNEHRQWAGVTTFTDLGADFLLGKIVPPRRITLQLASPATFKSGGKHVPLPLPDLVFGSLLERWNAFAPIVFPAELRRYAAECLAISRFHLSSRSVPVKRGGLRIGGVGQVTYTTTSYDRYWMSVCTTLAAYAQYAGVGAGTTMGLGQCRPLWEAQPTPG